MAYRYAGLLDNNVKEVQQSVLSTLCGGQVLGVVESPQHWLVCEAYRGFRDGVDPELVRRDRLPYLRKVIKKRRELEKKLKCQAQADEDDLQEE